jgi:hypothetical protein
VQLCTSSGVCFTLTYICACGLVAPSRVARHPQLPGCARLHAAHSCVGRALQSQCPIYVNKVVWARCATSIARVMSGQVRRAPLRKTSPICSKCSGFQGRGSRVLCACMLVSMPDS